MIPVETFLFVVGLATVFGLKRVWLRIPAGLLNLVLVCIGLYLIVIIPSETVAEIRRMLGVFCLLVGGVSAVALLVPRFAPRADEQQARDITKDAYGMLARATKLERQGRTQEALAAYEDITKQFAGTLAAGDAQKSMESLRATIG